MGTEKAISEKNLAKGYIFSTTDELSPALQEIEQIPPIKIHSTALFVKPLFPYRNFYFVIGKGHIA